MIAALVRCLSRLTTGPARSVARRMSATQGVPGQPDARRMEITWEEAEQLLSAGLLAGLVDRAEYQDCLELLAAADDARSPLEVPNVPN